MEQNRCSSCVYESESTKQHCLICRRLYEEGTIFHKVYEDKFKPEELKEDMLLEGFRQILGVDLTMHECTEAEKEALEEEKTIMEAIKTTSDLRFILKYADGEERRVNKGILFEETEDGMLNIHIGTDDQLTLFRAISFASDDILRRILRIREHEDGI